MPTRYFAPSELMQARSFVAEQGRRAGMPPHRQLDLVLAANEIITNAFKFAGQAARVRLWTEGDRLICEVTDEGAGIAHPSPGHTLPGPDRIAGRGIWLARELSDDFDLRTGPGGTSVKMAVDIEDRALAS
jgi:serine/threonine-protein kinase RsbW